MTKHAIAILSGGMDSTTLVYHLLNEGYEVDCLSFNYGQRHAIELEYAHDTARQLGLAHDIVDLTGLTHLISNSALTSQNKSSHPSLPAKEQAIPVPDGHYAEETMRDTVVPNRNMIMFSIAAGVAVNRKANTIAAGMHGGDHFIYPDCRPKFLYTLGTAILYGNEGFHNFFSGTIEDTKEELEAAGRLDMYEAAKAMGMTKTAKPLTTPFLDWTKAGIAYRALELGVPFHMTWSCYKGGSKHCGRCGTCVERLEAIDAACKRAVRDGLNVEVDISGLGYVINGSKVDQTEYEDKEYWKEAVAKEKANG